MGTFMMLSGIRFSVRGKHHFDNLDNAVVVCNHNSLLDIPISFPFLPRANKTIAKKSLSYVPIFGWIYSFGTVLVDRKDSRSRQESYNKMKFVLNHGLDMLIYPEGTRNTTSAPLKSFYDGAFKLAVETQKPIVPVVLLNTKNLLPAKPSMYFTPGKIIMQILPPVSPQGHSIDSLKQEIYDIMAKYYLENEPAASKA
jgi:1-acyl-sn-glycerol-3-phosphate acyltransferase